MTADAVGEEVEGVGLSEIEESVVFSLQAVKQKSKIAIKIAKSFFLCKTIPSQCLKVKIQINYTIL